MFRQEFCIGVFIILQEWFGISRSRIHRLLLVSSLQNQEAEVYHPVPAELCMYNLRVRLRMLGHGVHKYTWSSYMHYN